MNQISEFSNLPVRQYNDEFEDSTLHTGTLCGPAALQVPEGTNKCFYLNVISRGDIGMRSNFMPLTKSQALTVAAQIALQYGYKLEKDNG